MEIDTIDQINREIDLSVNVYTHLVKTLFLESEWCT